MITVVGYDGTALSPLAVERLATAALVVGGQRHLDAAALPDGSRTVVMGDVRDAVAAVTEANKAGDDVVVLASGDPGFFGIVRRLNAVPELALEVLPAVSAVARAFAWLGLPWDDAVVVSAHGRPPGPALAALRRFPKVAVLTDRSSSPAVLVRLLGGSCPELVVLERLGEVDERITTISGEARPGALTRTEAQQRDWREPLVVVRADHRADRSADGAQQWLSGVVPTAGWALPDEAFSHRDAMVTKREVRALALARLAPAVGQLVWDVGAGSGSVAVECSRLGAAVIAVDQGEDSCALVRANAIAHHAPVQVVHGVAPEALGDLPDPAAVFVGGGGPDVVEAVAARRPERVVVSLATLERVAPTLAALAGYQTDTVLLQAQRLQPLGGGSRLVPTNPVFVVAGELR